MASFPRFLSQSSKQYGKSDHLLSEDSSVNIHVVIILVSISFAIQKKKSNSTLTLTLSLDLSFYNNNWMLFLFIVGGDIKYKFSRGLND